MIGNKQEPGQITEKNVGRVKVQNLQSKFKNIKLLWLPF